MGKRNIEGKTRRLGPTKPETSMRIKQLYLCVALGEEFGIGDTHLGAVIIQMIEPQDG